MVVGTAGSGKTTIMNCLTRALTDLGIKHALMRMNPKAIKNQEMYGMMNQVTNDWIPGVFSEIWKRCNSKQNKHISWIICDGPVDAIWIENLNTVLDDNRILTLANAERIPMSENCKMVFEVENLNNASPATVSRCGIIFVSPTNLGWKPLIETWCKDRAEVKEVSHPEEGAWAKKYSAKYLSQGTDTFLMIQKDYSQVMHVLPVIMVT